MFKVGDSVHFFRPGSALWSGVVVEESESNLSVRECVTGKLRLVPKHSRWLTLEPQSEALYAHYLFSDQGLKRM